MAKGRRGQPSQLKSGRWRARIALGRDQNGKFKYRQVSAKTEEECLTKLKAIKESLGLMQKLDPHMPFGAWMDYWFREFCAPRLRESTQETYSKVDIALLKTESVRPIMFMRQLKMSVKTSSFV